MTMKNAKTKRHTIQHNIIKDLVYNIIKENATEEKPINQVDILSVLKKDPDNDCDRRTVGRALENLRNMYGTDDSGEWIDDNIRLHYIVVDRSSSKIYKDYWFEFLYDDDFTDDELMFLMNAVQFSKHIDKSQAEEITAKLAKLSHNSYSGVFELHTTINEKNVPVNKEFFKNLGDIDEAARTSKMISFDICKYGTDKKPYVVEHLEVCPFKVVISEGYYFLLCSKRSSEAIRSYRIDKIRNVKILDEQFTHYAARKYAAFHPNDYISEHMYMNSGETVDVTVEIDRAILDDVIDSFGTKIKIFPAEEGANRLTIRVKSSEKDIIDWAMRYGEYAEVTDPGYLRNMIIERALTISSNYRNNNEDINYMEMVERAENTHRLFLSRINLNGRESYKNLNGLRTIRMNHNGIRDFSFLESYKTLRELAISYNEIQNPEVISELHSLFSLTLNMTGITNLDFLRGLDGLTRLTIREFSLENIDAIYSLTGLKFLSVSKPVARLIDKKLLKKVFGDSLRYGIDIENVIQPSRPDTLPSDHMALHRREIEKMSVFSTVRLDDKAIRNELCSKIYTGTRYIGLKDTSFELVDEACDPDERKKMYEDITHYSGKEYTWFITYKTVEPIEKIDTDKVLAIAIFKKDHGLKLVSMARRAYRDETREAWNNEWLAWGSQIRNLMTMESCWAELGGELAKDFARYCTMSDVINPTVLKENKVFGDIEIDDDDYHYYRPYEGGKKNVKKIAYGHIVIE